MPEAPTTALELTAKQLRALSRSELEALMVRTTEAIMAECDKRQLRIEKLKAERTVLRAQVAVAARGFEELSKSLESNIRGLRKAKE